MENRIISNRRLASFRARLYEEERSAATVEKYLREVRQLAAWAGRGGGIQSRRHPVEGAPSPRGAGALHRQRKADRRKPLFHLRGLERLQGEPPEAAAPAVPGRQQGADPRGVSPPDLRGPPAWGRERLSLLMEAICGTGIRVSEVRKIGRGGIFLTSDTIAIFCPGSKLVLPSGGRKPGPTTIPLCRPALVIPESKFNRRRRGPFCAPVAPRPPWRRGESACAAWG